MAYVAMNFCALGADENTMAVAASRNPNQPTEDTNVTELEQAKEAQKQAEKQRDDALAELNKFKADQRAENIASLQKELNTTFSAEDLKSYTDMDDAVFAFTARQLRQFSATQPQRSQLPDYLTKHQAQGGQNQFNAGQPQSIADLAKARK